MDRRRFLEAIAGGLIAPPCVGEAQQPQGSYRIGFLCDYPYNPRERL